MFMVNANNTNFVIHRYPQEHYFTIFNRKTGFFARVEEKGHQEPLWAPKGPELLDISITNWCDRNCSICYKSSGVQGHHMSLNDYKIIMAQAKTMNVLQVALGGGNPNQHPDFEKILEVTRKDYGIVPSYTTNGRGLTDNVLEASKCYCGAVAVSAYEPYAEFIRAIGTLINYKIKVNVHFVLSRESIDIAIEWLQTPLPIFEKINAIIFLNYKPVGRCNNAEMLLKHSKDIKRFFDLASNNKNSFKIGFDSCCISGLVQYANFSQVCYDYCDSGRFSMYVSEDMKMYPCSFMVNQTVGIPIRVDNMIDVWTNSELFNEMRKRENNPKCIDCVHVNSCQMGCPIFPEINIC